MMFSASFLAPLLTRCSAISLKTRQNSGTVFSAASSLSPLPVFFHLRYIVGLSIKMLTIFSVFKVITVSASSYRGRTILFYALNAVSTSGHVLGPTVTKLGHVHARVIVTSVKMVLLEVSHRSRRKDANLGLSPRATLNDSPQNSKSLKKKKELCRQAVSSY